MKNTCTLFAILVLSIYPLISKAQVGITASIQCLNNGSQACVSFTATNFTAMISMQYSMHFDPAVMTYDLVQNVNLPSSFALNATQASSGTLIVSWFDAFFSGVTLPAGTVIYEICFDVIGSPGEYSAVSFNGSPVAIEFSNTGGIIASVLTPGSVNVNGGTLNLWSAGGDGRNWSDGANWCNGVPDAADDVIINYGEAFLDVQPVMASLTINGGTLVDSFDFAINAPLLIGATGVLNIKANTLDINSTINNNGKIEGFGTIDIEDATIVGGYGKYAPGNSAGTLRVKKTYCNEILESEIGGNGVVVEHDLLDVTQNIVAEGILNILYLGGTVPPGTRTILQCPTAGCLTGVFAIVTYPPECQGSCSINYTSNTVQLVNTLPIEFTGNCTWLGGTGDWSDQTKWSCNDVPNSNDTVFVNAGQVNLTAPVTVNSLTVSAGSISGSVPLTVAGSMTKNGSAPFTVNAPFGLSGGLLRTSTGVLDFNNNFTYGGTVGGSGVIDLTHATVQALSGGNFSPGLSPGTLTVLGNYANNILNVEVVESGGVISKDKLVVNGAVSLGGSVLNILPSGTMPTGIHQILTFGSNPGNTQFAQVNYGPLCGNCSLVYTPTSVSLSNTQACLPALTLENMTLLPGTYRSSGGLVSNLANVGAGSTVIFKSDTGVLLEQDFTVPPGAVFEIGIEACPQNANEVLPEPGNGNK